jgi:membrane dipeptidase
VGLGSDFDGISTTPVGLGDCAAFPEITLELLRRGHPEKVVRGVLGGNLLRVLEEVERSAAAG